MKRWKIVLAAVPMTMALAFPAFAGEWHQDMNGWWYETATAGSGSTETRTDGRNATISITRDTWRCAPDR